MGLKQYSVNLDEQVVEEAKKIMDESGRKLSPVINNFLIEWTAEHREDRN